MLEGRLLHVDSELIVVDKPAGIASTGRTLADEGCLQGRLIRQFGAMVWAVHQLDKPTSGVNVFTRSAAGVDRVRTAMTGPRGAKDYLALVHGEPSFDVLRVDVPVGLVDVERRIFGVGVGKPAQTTFTVLRRGRGFAWLQARLHTGRTHQVRLHLKHLGHPLVGERWYREPPCDRAPRHALHAWSLQLDLAEGVMRFEAPLPEDLATAGAGVGLALEQAELRVARPGPSGEGPG